MTELAHQVFNERLRLTGGRPSRALAEVIQYVVLLGLSRTDFFSVGAFYGGTALRMLRGIDRFSEDLDFSLDRPHPEFSLASYLTAIRDELAAFGFASEVTKKEKALPSPIESAFVKANTREHLIAVQAPRGVEPFPPATQLTKVKLEVDTDPPPAARFATDYVTTPIPFAVRAYDDPSLFAGKLAAVLARSWKSRVKGRDWYDFSFYASRGTPVLLAHLDARLRQPRYLTTERELTVADLKAYLHDRIDALDLTAAKVDVAPFVTNPANLDVWSAEFFHHLTDRLTAVE